MTKEKENPPPKIKRFTLIKYFVSMKDFILALFLYIPVEVT